jgi:hypothetical protein
MVAAEDLNGDDQWRREGLLEPSSLAGEGGEPSEVTFCNGFFLKAVEKAGRVPPVASPPEGG